MIDDPEKILKVLSGAKGAIARQILQKLKADEKLDAYEIRFIRNFETEIKKNGGPPLGEAEPRQVFRNTREVAAYLRKEGWKASQSTVYKHQNEGKIKINQDGTYALKDVLKYARGFLMLREVKQKIADEDLQRQKLRAEILRIQEQAKLAQIKRMAEEGRYILRSDFELELAARAVTLEANLKFLVQDRAGEWIQSVQGDRKRTGDLIHRINDDLDTMLNEFASEREFTITMTTGSAGKEMNDEGD